MTKRTRKVLPMRYPSLLILAALFLTPTATADTPVHTYSIVARDAESGQLGVAAHSHWFAIRRMVTWAEPGIGAVATQALTAPSYGPAGLAALADGQSAAEALQSLLAEDAVRDRRQVGIVDANGEVATHTGQLVIDERCDDTGDGVAVQANMMARPGVCDAMRSAFEATAGQPLADRLLAALKAAETAGGDIRGKQSAALVVVGAEPESRAWRRYVHDLRVDDHPEPLVELARLLALDRAYALRNESDGHLAAGRMEEAADAFERASALAPDNHEFLFWRALGLVNAGDVDAALPLFARAFALQPSWREVVPRLPDAGLLPDDSALVERITGL